MAIAEEGLCGNYGANIGKVLLATYGDQDVKVRAKAMAAAGSDARMNGCELPVVINSGSGNQGITASVPIVVFAKELQVSEETMYRALVISNLATIHIKEGIGRLSAYCGAVGAGMWMWRRDRLPVRRRQEGGQSMPLSTVLPLYPV